MTTGLTALPDELVELINGYLDIQDLCSLRSACRELAAKASGGIFQTTVSRGRLRLTEDGIKAFERIARPESLGSHIQELTILGIAHHSGHPPPFTETNLSILQRSFRDLKTASAEGWLRRITVEVAALVDGELSTPEFPAPILMNRVESLQKPPKRTHEKPPSLRQVYTTAAESFNTVMLALQTSQLLVNTLELFTTQTGCSIPCDALLPALVKIDKSILDGVRRLSIRICHPLPPKGGDDNHEHGYSKETDCKEMEAAEFLNAFKCLDSLEIWYFSIAGRRSSTSPSLVAAVSKASRWLNLRTLELHGLIADVEPLNRLFDAHLATLERISMVEVGLTGGGTFNHILDAITARSDRIRYLHFENQMQRCEVSFDQATDSPETFADAIAEVREMHDRRFGSEPDNIFIAEHRIQEYGPPVRSID